MTLAHDVAHVEPVSCCLAWLTELTSQIQKAIAQELLLSSAVTSAVSAHADQRRVGYRIEASLRVNMAEVNAD